MNPTNQVYKNADQGSVLKTVNSSLKGLGHISNRVKMHNLF